MRAVEGFHNFIWIFWGTIRSFTSLRLFAPWAVLALLQGILLLLLFYFLVPPVDKIMVPVLKLVFGDRFFHFPGSLVLLPKAFYYGNLLLGIIAGSFLGGVAAYLFAGHFSGERGSFRGGLSLVFSRYPSLILLWAVGTLLFVLILVFPQKLFSSLVVGSPRRALALQVGSFTLALAAVTFFTYAFISVVLSRSNVLDSIRESFQLARRRFLSTFFFVSIPFLIHLPLDYLLSDPEVIVAKFNPHLVVYLLAVAIAVSLFSSFLLVGNLTRMYQLTRGESFR